MSMPVPPEQPTALVRALRRLRWPLAVLLGLVFAAGRFIESTLLGIQVVTPLTRTVDPLIWGLLAAIAVWVLLSWAAGQEQRYRTAEARVTADLKRSNATLELLYEINQRIASSATLDATLDYAISLPGRLLGAQAAAIVLLDEDGAALTARSVGLGSDELTGARASFALTDRPPQLDSPHLLVANIAARFSYCVILPLVEQGNPIAPLGWVEAYLERDNGRRPAMVRNNQLDPEGQNLLITVVGELAEALLGARRRAREIESVTALESAIAAERTRIAHDLHDGVAQSLAFMRMRVDLWEDWLRDEPGRLHEEFVALKANLRTQIEELRRAIFALRPVELSQLGFEGALRRFVSDFADQQGWDLELNLSLPYELPHVLELAAFRVVQEALTNAVKHAHARTIGVNLRLADGGLEIIVSDDGIGFEFSAQGSSSTAQLGLRQMRERALALDGRVTVIAQPGAGTEIRAWFPIVYARGNL